MIENKIDWVTIMLYAAIIIFGWLNIYAACYDESHSAILDLTTKHGKQLLWIAVSLLLALVITHIRPSLYSATAYIIYLVILGLLVITLFIGSVIKGGQSWIDFGFFKFQPSEFAKFATALALAKYISSLDNENDYNNPRTKVIAWTLILIPAALILLQHDTGSALVFASFLLPLYRHGMSAKILVMGLVAVILFVVALLVEKYIIIGVLAAIGLLYLFVWLSKRTRKHYIWTIAIFLICSIFTFSVDFVFDNILEKHQRDRIYVLLGKTEDKKGSGYNVYQSKIAIGSGGLTGKGFLNGTITKADFVPEQETDFIFCTVGEEWGFLGSSAALLLYIGLLMRLVRLADRQRSRFSRFYGFSVASILFIHIFINIGMVLGLLPVIGIPLPFFSYGGSSLMAFTILLFIFLRLDQSRTELV
ncbi:MAG: rod shape-determining protein RodA [Bacteroidales bacterium]|nr:rod shape-determining protein RodA [Bacteroidales bacterium]